MGHNLLSAVEAARRVRAGEITSETLVRDCLDRVAAREDQVGAWAFIDPEAALEQARHRDRATPTGALHGVPVAIKDIIDTADMPTAYGSPIYAGHRPAADAACVALLRRAGAVILGKTVTTEFAAVTPGRTTNPHNAAHSPGGSSSGSAAAVADFMAPLAIGTQTVGSVIRPAAYCGVVGFKPSFGAFSLAGVKAQAESFDTLGAMARSVADIRLISGALLGGEDAFAAPPLEHPPAIGICRTPHWPDADPATVTALTEAAEKLAASGAQIGPEVGEVALPDTFAALLDAHWTVLKFEFARVLAHERDAHGERLSDPLRGLLDEGWGIPVEDYRAALALAAECRNAIAPHFGQYDVLLTPSAKGEAPKFGAPPDLLFQRLWTALHLPCITLPASTGPHGLPVGVMLVGAHAGDARLLAAAEWVEDRLTSRRANISDLL